jgi:hypothetical protein
MYMSGEKKKEKEGDAILYYYSASCTFSQLGILTTRCCYISFSCIKVCDRIISCATGKYITSSIPSISIIFLSTNYYVISKAFSFINVNISSIGILTFSADNFVISNTRSIIRIPNIAIIFFSTDNYVISRASTLSSAISGIGIFSFSIDYYVISRTASIKMEISRIDIISFSTEYYVISRTITRFRISNIFIISPPLLSI